MEIPEWIIFPFDVEVESVNLNAFLEEEFIEMTSDFKGIEYFYTNEKTVVKYSKLCANVKPILLAFSSQFILETEFIRVYF